MILIKCFSLPIKIKNFLEKGKFVPYRAAENLTLTRFFSGRKTLAGDVKKR